MNYLLPGFMTKPPMVTDLPMRSGLILSKQSPAVERCEYRHKRVALGCTNLRGSAEHDGEKGHVLLLGTHEMTSLSRKSVWLYPDGIVVWAAACMMSLQNLK
jgi:hypothetical protein